MGVSPTPFGHVGLFPEQAENWRWLRDGSAETTDECPALNSPAVNFSALNLFGYSGASTIALATTGMSVAHVDAAKANVNACRAAAELNDLTEHPIRFLVDDAAKFAARELRRGNVYHTIVMDPPAYGHGPSGKAWRLERDLWPLLKDCLQLFNADDFRLLITGHSPQVGAEEVRDYLRSMAPAILGLSKNRLDACTEYGRLVLRDEAARRLDAGFYVRVESRKL